MFIASAHAQEAATAAAATPSGWPSLIPLILIFAIFYFLIIRPQQKKMKEHDALIRGVKRKDVIVTGGGIIGTVQQVEDEKGIVMVEIAEGVVVRVNRSTIAGVIDEKKLKEAPASATEKKAGKPKKKSKGESA